MDKGPSLVLRRDGFASISTLSHQLRADTTLPLQCVCNETTNSYLGILARQIGAAVPTVHTFNRTRTRTGPSNQEAPSPASAAVPHRKHQRHHHKQAPRPALVDPACARIELLWVPPWSVSAFFYGALAPRKPQKLLEAIRRTPSLPVRLASRPAT